MDGLHSTGLHLWEGMLAHIKAILNWDVHASLEFYVKEATFISFSSLYLALCLYFIRSLVLFLLLNPIFYAFLGSEQLVFS